MNAQPAGFPRSPSPIDETFIHVVRMTMPLRFVSCLTVVAAVVLLLSGCGVSDAGGNGRANAPGGGNNGNGNGATETAGPWRIQSANFHDPLGAVAANGA